MDTIVTEKRCSKCGEVKSTNQFYMGSSRGKPVLNSWCKKCFNIKAKEYQKKTKERKKERQRERYYQNIEKEQARARKNTKNYREKHPVKYYITQVLWRENNRTRFNELQRDSYYRNHEQRKESHRDWMKSNPGKNREYKANRRARKLGAGGTYTANQFKDLCEKYHNVCLCCGNSGKLVADHVVPLSKGGSNSIENIQPLCFSCNSKKHTKTIDYRY